MKDGHCEQCTSHTGLNINDFSFCVCKFSRFLPTIVHEWSSKAPATDVHMNIWPHSMASWMYISTRVKHAVLYLRTKHDWDYRFFDIVVLELWSHEQSFLDINFIYFFLVTIINNICIGIIMEWNSYSSGTLLHKVFRNVALVEQFAHCKP